MKVNYSYLLEQFTIDAEITKRDSAMLHKHAHAEEMLNGIKELLLKTGQFTLGPQVKELEDEFAKLCQTKYAVGVNSGTDALFLSMKALGVGQGDEVITAPNSFISTAGSIANTGAKPVFVDVNDEYNIDPDLIEAAITPRTKAIIPVHLTGNPADMLRIMGIAERHKIHVVEDAAQAIGASINGKFAGSFGSTGCFSFHPLKNINVWGDGGMVVTDSKKIYERIALLRNHGLKNRDDCVMFGYNSRLDTLQAIVALRLMKDLDTITNTRIRHARLYDEALSKLKGCVTLPPRRPNVRQVFHTYVIRAKNRNGLYKYLLKNGIEAKVHYPIPIHLQEAAAYLGYKEGDFPECEAQAKSIITLPVHQHLSRKQLDFVIDTIGRFYKR